MSDTSTTSAAGASDDFDLSDSGVASLFGGSAETTTTTTETDTPPAATTTDSTTSSTETTNDSGVSDEGTTTTDAGATTTDATTDQGNADDTSSTSQIDADLDDWAVKTGRAKPTTDAERSVLQELRNTSRDFTRSRQAAKTAKDLQTAMVDTDPAKANQVTTTDDDDEGDPLVGKVSTLEKQLASERSNRLQSEFYQSANDGKGVTADEGEAMIAVFKDKVDKGGQKAFEHWSDPSNLGDLHELAQVRLAETTRAADAERTRTEERERLAKLQQANSPAANAKTTETKQTKSVEEIRNEMWRKND